MHRAIVTRKRLTAAIVPSVAAFAGSLVRTIPGVGGALLLCFGLGMAYEPLGFIAAGVFLLVADRRMP